MFRMADTDNSGSISKSELKEMLESMGEKLSTFELDVAFAMIDKDGSGSISFDEFLSLITECLKDESKGDE